MSNSLRKKPIQKSGVEYGKRSRSLAADLVETLVSRIRMGEWAAGQKIPTESMLEGQYKVSRTVIRESLSRLQAMGLVQVEFGRGTFVSNPLAGDPIPFWAEQDQFEKKTYALAVLELRLGIETQAAKLASQRRTDKDLFRMRELLDEFETATSKAERGTDLDFQFHMQICRATQNEHFVAVFSALGRRAILRGSVEPPDKSMHGSPSYANQVIAEHLAIFQAIENRDAQSAFNSMQDHLLNSKGRLEKASSVVHD